MADMHSKFEQYVIGYWMSAIMNRSVCVQMHYFAGIMLLQVTDRKLRGWQIVWRILIIAVRKCWLKFYAVKKKSIFFSNRC